MVWALVPKQRARVQPAVGLSFGRRPYGRPAQPSAHAAESPLGVAGRLPCADPGAGAGGAVASLAFARARGRPRLGGLAERHPGLAGALGEARLTSRVELYSWDDHFSGN